MVGWRKRYPLSDLPFPDLDKNNSVLSIATPDDSVCEVRLDIESNRGALWLGDISCDKGDFVWQEAKGTQERDDEKDIRS